jgi:hypothetical protein
MSPAQTKSDFQLIKEELCLLFAPPFDPNAESKDSSLENQLANNIPIIPGILKMTQEEIDKIIGLLRISLRFFQEARIPDNWLLSVISSEVFFKNCEKHSAQIICLDRLFLPICEIFPISEYSPKTLWLTLPMMSMPQSKQRSY